MALKRANEYVGSGLFFKPETYKDSVAILFEPKSVERDVFDAMQGKNRDEVLCDVTVFESQADLDAGVGTELKGIKVTHGGITRGLSRAIGEQVVGKLSKKKFPKGVNPSWVIDNEDFPIDDATFDKVASYYENREAGVKAALADVPEFS